MSNKQTIGILSMSLASVASGAFASIGENVLDKTPDNLGIDSNISLHKSTSVDGVRYAKRYSPSFVGSSVSSSNDPNGTSSIESCYSNCHDNPICEDYSKGTTCPTGYTKDICADDSSFWNCTCHTDTIQQCLDANFTKTSCSTGYTLSGQCPDNTAYYSSCTCHTDCTEMYQDALESKSDSSDMFASDLDWSGTVVEATGITGSGAVSISTVPWYTSLSAAQQIINATAADLATYNNACSGSMTWSCYSNCHTEVVDCPGYLTSLGTVSVVTTAEELTTAASSSNSIVAVLNNMTAADSTTLTGKKLVGPKYFTASAECMALSTPTVSGVPKLGLINFDQVDIANGNGSYVSTTDVVTLKDVTVRCPTRVTGINMSVNGSNLGIDGTVNVYDCGLYNVAMPSRGGILTVNSGATFNIVGINTTDSFIGIDASFTDGYIMGIFMNFYGNLNISNVRYGISGDGASITYGKAGSSSGTYSITGAERAVYGGVKHVFNRPTTLKVLDPSGTYNYALSGKNVYIKSGVAVTATGLVRMMTSDGDELSYNGNTIASEHKIAGSITVTSGDISLTGPYAVTGMVKATGHDITLKEDGCNLTYPSLGTNGYLYSTTLTLSSGCSGASTRTVWSVSTGGEIKIGSGACRRATAAKTYKPASYTTTITTTPFTSTYCVN